MQDFIVIIIEIVLSPSSPSSHTSSAEVSAVMLKINDRNGRGKNVREIKNELINYHMICHQDMMEINFNLKAAESVEFVLITTNKSF